MGHTEASSTPFSNIASFNKTHNKSMDEKPFLYLPTANNTNGVNGGYTNRNIIDKTQNLTK